MVLTVSSLIQDDWGIGDIYIYLSLPTALHQSGVELPIQQPGVIEG